jgi:hypothetical protein
MSLPPQLLHSRDNHSRSTVSSGSTTDETEDPLLSPRSFPFIFSRDTGFELLIRTPHIEPADVADRMNSYWETLGLVRYVYNTLYLLIISDDFIMPWRGWRRRNTIGRFN